MIEFNGYLTDKAKDFYLKDGVKKTPTFTNFLLNKADNINNTMDFFISIFEE